MYEMRFVHLRVKPKYFVIFPHLSSLLISLLLPIGYYNRVNDWSMNLVLCSISIDVPRQFIDFKWKSQWTFLSTQQLYTKPSWDNRCTYLVQ